MEHRLLRYFVTVAEELHFGRAAARLHLAQQPLSAAIKRLEDQIGVRLFERTSRKVELTEAGRLFLMEAKVILQRTTAAIALAQRAERGEVGRLAVGYAAGTLHNVLPASVRRFQERYPGVELTLQELSSPEIEAALVKGEVLVGLLCPPVINPELQAEVVLREPLILALPDAHALAKRSEIPLQAVAAEPFVIYQRAVKPAYYDTIVSLCREVGFTPRIVQEVATEAAVMGLVAAGMGVALVSWSQQSTQLQGVVYRSLEGPTAEVALVISWLRNNESLLVRSFLNTVRQVASELVVSQKESEMIGWESY